MYVLYWWYNKKKVPMYNTSYNSLLNRVANFQNSMLILINYWAVVNGKLMKFGVMCLSDLCNMSHHLINFSLLKLWYDIFAIFKKLHCKWGIRIIVYVFVCAHLLFYKRFYSVSASKYIGHFPP